MGRSSVAGNVTSSPPCPPWVRVDCWLLLQEWCGSRKREFLTLRAVSSPSSGGDVGLKLSKPYREPFPVLRENDKVVRISRSASPMCGSKISGTL